MRYFRKSLPLFLLVFLAGCAHSPKETPTKRLQADADAVHQLTQDLATLTAGAAAGVSSGVVLQEAALLAKILVETTRETNKVFKMHSGPYMHNWMIHMGFKKQGFCYHWVPALLNALPQKPMQAFERHWGGAYESMGRENNGVIITRRGAPLETGLVYDAWRGSGKPSWRAVKGDKYPWTERFTEQEILAGLAKVEPK